MGDNKVPQGKRRRNQLGYEARTEVQLIRRLLPDIRLKTRLEKSVSKYEYIHKTAAEMHEQMYEYDYIVLTPTSSQAEDPATLSEVDRTRCYLKDSPQLLLLQKKV